MARFTELIHGSILIFLALFCIWSRPSTAIAASDITTIDGYVWLDMDQDGLREDDELGVNKIIVNLLDPLTSLTLQRVTTDISGYYEFQVMPGEYQILFEAQERIFTTNQYANLASGSHVDPERGITLGLTDIINPSSEQWVGQQNAGLLPAKIGGQVWLDYDRNGAHGGQEMLIPDLQVNLLDGINDRQVQSVMTDAQGVYTFTVPPGNYLVEFVAPPESFTTRSNVGTGYSHAIPNDTLQVGQTEPINLSFGKQAMDLDAGLLPATISDSIWLDLNENGQQDESESGIANLLVTLLDDEGNLLQSTLTDEVGIYRFTVEPFHSAYVVQINEEKFDNLENPDNRAAQDVSPVDIWLEHAQSLQNDVRIESRPITLTYGQQYNNIEMALQPAQIGGTIWHDHNGNGLREAGDDGWGGLQVILFDATNGIEMGSTFSAEDGTYLFQAEPGVYTIGFVKEANMLFSHTPPSENEQMAVVGTNKVSYSHVNPLTEEIEGVVANFGELKLDSDAGVYRTATLGDWVWFDRDGDGLQGEEETGVADFGLSLYNSQDELIALTFSDSNGFYRFNNLVPDHYYVAPTLSADNAVDNSTDYLISPVDQGRSDANDNDLVPTLEKSDIVTITSGHTHISLDVGLTKPGTLQSYVWFDADRDGVRGPEESGVSDVTVTLYDEWNQPIQATHTDEDGRYQFTEIPPAVYTLAFNKPTGFDFAPLAQGESSDLDSDVDPYSGRTILFQLYAEEINQHWSAGLVIPREQINLVSFTARQSRGTEVTVQWETSHAVAENGFRIYNNTEPDLQNAQWIYESIEHRQPHQQTHTYLMKQQIEAVMPDPDAIEMTVIQKTYYWLLDMENGVEVGTYGPIEVLIQPFEDIFLPVVYR